MPRVPSSRPLRSRTIRPRTAATPRVRRSISNYVPQTAAVEAAMFNWYNQVPTSLTTVSPLEAVFTPVQSDTSNTTEYTVTTYITGTAQLPLEPSTEVVQSDPVVEVGVVQTPVETAPAAPVEPPEPTLKDTYGERYYNKLSQVFCKYKGQWIYLYNITDGYYSRYENPTISYYVVGEPNLDYQGRLQLKTIPVKEAFTKDFEFDQHKLGYFNYKDACFHVTKRLGSTGGYVGLSLHYLKFNPISVHSHNYWQDKGFLDMLNGLYAPATEAWSVVGAPVVEKMLARAISNKASISRQSLSVVTINYMGEQVGEVLVKRDGSTTLDDAELYPSYSHLVSYFETTCGFTPKVAQLEDVAA